MSQSVNDVVKVFRVIFKSVHLRNTSGEIMGKLMGRIREHIINRFEKEWNILKSVLQNFWFRK